MTAAAQTARNKKDPSLAKYLKEVFDEIYAAHIFFNVYWVLRNKEDRERFTDTMNEYGGFFMSAIHAYFLAMVMALSKAYDKKNISIYTALEQIRRSGRLHPEVVRNLRKRLRKIETVKEKIYILRDCVYAHISTKLDTAAAFKKAQITPNDFRDAIQSTFETWQLMNGLTERVAYPLLDNQSEVDTRQLLSDLCRCLTPRY